jgi:alpha-beta hydrolase superfamily lysophospholipase
VELMEKLGVDLIKFKTKDGLMLDGFISKSRPKNKKLIIHLHGMTGDFFRGFFLPTWIRKLNGTKYDLFSINTRGYGLITKFYCGKEKKLIGTAHEKIEETIYDIDAAIKTGKKLGYKEFILAGHSTGCQKVTYYQSKKKNKKVKALLLLSPCDDYNLEKVRIDYQKALHIAKKMVANGKGNDILPKEISNYSAKSYLSFADPKNVEAQLFNYSGKLKHFSNIKVPILALFGGKDAFADKNAKEMLEVLRKKTKSKLFVTSIIPNAIHVYSGKEKEVAKVIADFLRVI